MLVASVACARSRASSSMWEVVMSTSPSTTRTSEAPHSTVSILSGVTKLCLREGINIGSAGQLLSRTREGQRRLGLPWSRACRPCSHADVGDRTSGAARRAERGETTPGDATLASVQSSGSAGASTGSAAAAWTIHLAFVGSVSLATPEVAWVR